MGKPIGEPSFQGLSNLSIILLKIYPPRKKVPLLQASSQPIQNYGIRTLGTQFFLGRGPMKGNILNPPILTIPG